MELFKNTNYDFLGWKWPFSASKYRLANEASNSSILGPSSNAPFFTATATAIVIRLYNAAKYPSRLDAAIDHSMTESSADTTASSLDIGGIGVGGGGVTTIS